MLGLKHADRTDLIKPAAGWMARAGADLLKAEPLLVPVPIHWVRRVKRRYNQSAELARSLAATTGVECLPDALVRTRPTAEQNGLSPDARFTNQSGSIEVKLSAQCLLAGRNVVLIDDVMTSGATLSVAAEALQDAGVSRVSVLTLARAVRRP